MLYNNYDSAGTWLNKWFYRYNPGFGVAEWRDDYPNNKKVVLKNDYIRQVIDIYHI